jgi:hypothetical protein
VRMNVLEADVNGQLRVIGWFDHRKAERFDERHSQNPRRDEHQILFYTAEGRWVLHGYVYWQPGAALGKGNTFISGDQARGWLERNGHGEAAEHYFSETAERGPGRPAIGGRVTIPIGGDRLAAVDVWARDRKVSRAEAIRQLLDIALETTSAAA